MKITLAWPWTGPDGVTHDPDTTVEVDRSTGSVLLHRGLARRAVEVPAAPAAPTPKPRRRRRTATTPKEK